MNKKLFIKIYSIFCFAYVILSFVYFLLKTVNITNKIYGSYMLNGLETNFLGMTIDNSDFQWRVYRENLPLILIFFSVFALFSQMIKAKFPSYIKLYYLTLSCLFVLFLHGEKFIYLILIILLYHKVIKVILPLTNNKRVRFIYIIFTWVYPIAFKILSEVFSGFTNLGLCNFEIIPWNLCYNLVLLRMISFSYELLSNHNLDKSNNDQNQHLLSVVIQQSDIVKFNHCSLCFNNKNSCQGFYVKIIIDNIKYFTFSNFIIYCFYPALYFSGPMITYNSFIYQIENNKLNKSFISNNKIYLYLLRIIALLVSFEIFNSLLYLNALMTNKYNTNEKILSLLMEDKALFFFMGLFLLCFIWYKFSIIWKIARFFSLLDNISTEENMNRCVFNNYCFEDFWRAWHKSFNQWLIKYIYIPLGGHKYKTFSIWVIFTFVALWHDLRFNLLIWAWFICLCLIPEIIIKKYYHKNLKGKLLYDILKHILAGLYIILLISSNLIGFGLGDVGFKSSLFTLAKEISLKEVVIVYLTYLTLVNIQFIIRNYENYKAKQMKEIFLQYQSKDLN